MEAFLARNFYQGQDLSIKPITWGHWSNRLVKEEGNVYGQLFGSHFFPKKKYQKLPFIYVYRDGRAVANSIWRTDNFLNAEDSQLTFHEFLNQKLDWEGSTGTRVQPTMTIAQHWYKHVSEWQRFIEQCPQALMISYEDVLSDPSAVYSQIYSKFFSNQEKLPESEIDRIRDKQGIKPNSARSREF